MTKSEFYKDYVDNEDCCVSDVRGLISQEDLWDCCDLRDIEEYDNWVESSFKDILRCDGLRYAKDFIEGVNDISEDYDYAMFDSDTGEFEEAFCDTHEDALIILKMIEDWIDSYAGWEDEPEDEECEVFADISSLL